MPKAKRPARRRPTPSRTSRFVCPECGFKAAHAMGLGRHRTSQHGVPSKRELIERSNSKGLGGAKVARLEKRVAQLEKRYDELVKGLRRTAGAAKR